MNRRHVVSRRQFLRRSAGVAAVAGFAMPTIIPAGVLARQGAVGANDRIGVAGIGVGRQGGGLVRGAHRKSDVRMVAVADVHLPRAEQVAQSLDAVAYQDYRKLLERRDVDAVITATTDHWRALVCIHAAQA